MLDTIPSLGFVCHTSPLYQVAPSTAGNYTSKSAIVGWLVWFLFYFYFCCSCFQWHRNWNCALFNSICLFVCLSVCLSVCLPVGRIVRLVRSLANDLLPIFEGQVREVIVDASVIFAKAPHWTFIIKSTQLIALSRSHIVRVSLLILSFVFLY